MKTLFFDCGMGAAGDMMVASLIELTDNPEQTVRELNALGIPDTEFVREDSVKCGITGTHTRVIVAGQEEDEHLHEHHHHDHDHHHDDHDHHHDHDHEHEHEHTHEHEHHHDHDHGHSHHHHSSMHSIEHIVRDHINVSDKVKDDVMAVYQLIAEAESTVHNTPIENIHFHEVGTMDAVADITAVCYLINKINPDVIYASPVHVGKGTVKCAHGILPVPAPATALILTGIPIYSREEINGELCTPTGAALLKHFVKEFKPMPVLTVEKIGYGMGMKDFPVANCLRAILGESEQAQTGTVTELDFNVDDMTGEEIGYLTEKLLENGANEVFVTPVYMKKNRPGNLITVLCRTEKEEEFVRTIFQLTSTVGIRKSVKERFVLDRNIEKVKTSLGTVRKKVSSGYGVTRTKFEYEDLAKIADKKGMSIREIRKKIGE